MTLFESLDLSKWLPIILIPLLIIFILALSCWYRQRKKKKFEKIISRTKPIDHLSSTNKNVSHKSSPIIASQLTNTDKVYLDKLVRTASDRSMWKRDLSKKTEPKKLRKVPSGLIEEKS